MLDIFKKELTTEEAEQIRERLKDWKDEVAAKLYEQVEEVKASEIRKINEESITYKKKLKRTMKNKLNEAIEQLRISLKSEILSESYSENPEMQIFEQVKQLIAPLVGKEQVSETTLITSLQAKVKELESKETIREGNNKLEELIAPYDKKTQIILKRLIGEGSAEEVTEKFYDIAESLNQEDEKLIAESEESEDEVISEELDFDDEDEDDDGEGDTMAESFDDEVEETLDEDYSPSIDDQEELDESDILEKEFGTSEKDALKKLASF